MYSINYDQSIHEGSNMNNNYAIFVEKSLTTNDEFEPHGYQQEVQQVPTHSATSSEDHIEQMLLKHSKYYVYCE